MKRALSFAALIAAAVVFALLSLGCAKPRPMPMCESDMDCVQKCNAAHLENCDY